MTAKVVRTGSKVEPRISTGIALVGRTWIILSKDINQRKYGGVVLTVPKGAGYMAEGYILITMEIKRIDDMKFFHR